MSVEESLFDAKVKALDGLLAARKAELMKQAHQ